VQLKARKVFVSEKKALLSRKEYDLLLYFLSNIDAALTKESIAEHLWGNHMDSSDSLDMGLFAYQKPAPEHSGKKRKRLYSVHIRHRL